MPGDQRPWYDRLTVRAASGPAKGKCWADRGDREGRRSPLAHLRSSIRVCCLDRGIPSDQASQVSTSFELGHQSSAPPEAAFAYYTNVAPTSRDASGPTSKGRPTESAATTSSRCSPPRGTTLGRWSGGFGRIWAGTSRSPGNWYLSVRIGLPLQVGLAFRGRRCVLPAEFVLVWVVRTARGPLQFSRARSSRPACPR